MSELPLPYSTGVIKRVAGTDPAANTEVSDTVPIGANEVQTIAGTPSATFALSFAGETGPTTLTTTATAASVQTYLRALSTIGPTGVSCTGGPLNTTITVTFDGVGMSQRDQPLLAVSSGATGITIATTTAGTGPKAWALLAVSVQCVQGATQTPFPSLIIDDGSNVLFQSFCGTAAISAATTVQCTWAPSLPAFGAAATTANTGPLPYGLILQPGYRLRTSTTGIGANTNYGAPSYLVCELG